MGAEKKNETWLSSLWGISWKTFQPEKGVIGILGIEVASSMSMVVKLWQSLSDVEILKLRQEILNSVGIRNLVSEDDDYLMTLALEEIVGNLVYVAKFLARLGKQCSDPVYHRFEHFFVDPVKNCVEWCGWEYRWKKMERKVKKMDKFMSLMLQLTQEQEVLSEMEQTLRRMKSNPLSDKVKLYEFQQKVIWQRQEVRVIRNLSPWNRTYDYIVRLLARSVFTILEKITFVFGINKVASPEGNRSGFVCRSRSFSAQMQSSVHPSEPHLPLLHSGPLGCYHRLPKRKGLNHIGSLIGCMDVGSDSPIDEQSHKPANPNLTENKDVGVMPENIGIYIYPILAVSYSKHGRVAALPSTLGNAALALHYANLILQIEKVAASPHLLGLDARDNLYKMLPTSIRAALRARLKPFDLPVSDAKTVTKMLEWLAPVAHNTIKWPSERSIEKQRVVSGANNVLLVQTLYFADQEKAEAAITELLVGLNYLCKVRGKPSRKLCHATEKSS